MVKSTSAPPAKKAKKAAAAAEVTSPAAEVLLADETAPLKKRSPKPRAAKADGAAAAAPSTLGASDAPPKKLKKRKAAEAEAPASSDAPLPKKPKAAKAGSAATAITCVSAAALEAAQVGKTALDVPQIDRAVRALLTHVQRERAGALLDADPPVHVLLATKQMPKAVGKAKACKPVPLALPHPFLTLETAEICLFTKDPQREYKDRLASAGVRAKVIGVSKLKKKHKEYEAKRLLMSEYEIFLADACVLPMLPPLLGKAFFQKRKLPTAVDLRKTDIKAELEKAVCGTPYRHAAGTSNSLMVGTTAQSPAQLVDNIVAAVEQAVKRIPGKWTNIQSLQLRTTNSVALPFFNELPSA